MQAVYSKRREGAYKIFKLVVSLGNESLSAGATVPLTTLQCAGFSVEQRVERELRWKIMREIESRLFEE